MILVLKEDNGEQYEDYQEWVNEILEINTTDTNKDMLYKYFIYMKQVMAENELEIDQIHPNVDYANNFMLSKRHLVDKEKSGRYTMPAKVIKLFEKIKKQYPFYTWLNIQYEVTKLSFEEIHI